MIQTFNKTHPDIRVVATYEGSYTGGGPEQQKLLAAIAAHSVPDIAQLEVHSMPVFASTGALMPLTTFIQHSTGDRPSDLLSGMLESTQYQGVTYGVPFNRSLPVMFYNKTMFQAAHLSGPPNTWAQVRQDAQVLTHGNGTSKVYGFAPLDQWWFWEVYTWEAGQHMLSPNLQKATFDTPAAADLFDLTVQMQHDGTAVIFSGADGWGLTTASFYSGKVAMDEDSSASIGIVTKNVGNKFQWGVAMMPKDLVRAVPPGGANLVIMSGIPKATAQAAWTFMQWVTAPAQTRTWSEETGYLPVQKAAVTSAAYQAYLEVHPAEKVALQEVKYQHAPPPSPHYLGIYGYAQDAMDAMYFANTPPLAALKKAAQQADALISGQ
jgi:ABC-type glycerol-3-phosphate transport system substrate-binding protein